MSRAVVVAVTATLLASVACSDAGAASDRQKRREERRETAREAVKDALFEMSELEERVVTVSGDFDGVTTRKDVAYGDDPAQRLDVYAPVGTSESPRGIVLMAHGGGWRRGDKRARGVVQHKVEAFVQRHGLIFVSTNYRMTPPNPHIEAEDVAAAIAFVQQHAAEWGGDAARVVLMGHSAGAHLVTLVATEPTYLQTAGAAPVRGVVSLDSGSIDVVATMSRPHFGLYDEPFGSDPAFWAKVSPMARLQARTAGPLVPTLIVCSTTRRDACPQGERFKAEAARLQGRVDVLPVDLDHGHVNLDLGQPSAYTSAVQSFLAAVGLHELALPPAPSLSPSPTTSTPSPSPVAK